MKTIFCVSLLALTVGAADISKASADEAKRHFQRSRELYDDGDLSGALNELNRAYSVAPNYKLLFNMAQIQASQLNHAAALKSFRQFMQEGGSEIPEARRNEVQKEIDKLRSRVGEMSIVVNLPGAEISVDDVVVGKSPLSAPITVNGGKRRVVVSLQNYFPVTRGVDVIGLETTDVKIELQPLAAPSKTENQTAAVVTSNAQPKEAGIPVWIPWAATGALAVGAVVSGVVTLGSAAKQKELIGTFGITAQEQTAAATATRTGALVTDILGGAAIAAAVGSLIYTLTRPTNDPATAAVTSIGISNNGLVVSGAF